MGSVEVEVAVTVDLRVGSKAQVVAVAAEAAEMEAEAGVVVAAQEVRQGSSRSGHSCISAGCQGSTIDGLLRGLHLPW